MVKVIVVEDEELPRKRAQEILLRIPEIDYKGSASSGKEALQLIKAHKPDLLVLDIKLKDTNGIELLSSIPKASMPAIVFTTAYDEYAVRAFELHALDYLMKPFSDIAFEKAILRAIDLIKKDSKEISLDNLSSILDYLSGHVDHDEKGNFINIRIDNKINFIKLKDILYIQASGYYVEIITHDKKYLHRETLSNIHNSLNYKNFIRIHRSTVVNSEYIKECVLSSFGEMDVRMMDGKLLRIGRTYKKEFLESLNL